MTNKELYKFKESSLFDPYDLWNVTPKVDGSNFAIYFDETGSIVPAKRGGTLTMTTAFFNFQRVFDKYGVSAFTNMYEAIRDVHHTFNNEPVIDVSFHGELCGGHYPDMPTIPGAKRVQARIHYSNDTEFVMFDIRLWTGDSRYYYMPHDMVVWYCRDYGIPVVPILHVGTLDECLAWSAQHRSDPDIMWDIFGMPHEVEGNLREGHVIKPHHKTLFKGDSRVIFKDKSDKFNEGGKNKIKKDYVPVKYSDALMGILEFVHDYVNYNRFCSVTSKFGEFSIKDFGTLMKLMVEDIEDELTRDGDYEGLTEVDKCELHKILIKKVSAEFVANKKEWF